MKKINVLTASLFAVALIAGASGVASLTQAQATPVGCTVSASSVVAGSPITLTASGGNGTYTWSSPNLVITNPTSTSTSFTVTFSVPGNYPVTVTSGGTTATCNVRVTATEEPAPGGGIEAPTPGLPNTGELPA